jgi:hypothetical protein
VIDTDDDDAQPTTARTDVHGPDGKMNVCAVECSTCIFNTTPANVLHLRPGRLRQLIESCRRRDTYVVCHSTMDTAQPAVCRGFFDRFSSNAIRIFGRLDAIVYINPPEGGRP